MGAGIDCCAGGFARRKVRNRLLIRLWEKLAGGEQTKTTCLKVKLFSALPSSPEHPPQAEPIGLKSPRPQHLDPLCNQRASRNHLPFYPATSLYIMNDNAKETASVTNPVPLIEAPLTLPEYMVEVVA